MKAYAWWAVGALIGATALLAGCGAQGATASSGAVDVTGAGGGLPGGVAVGPIPGPGSQLQQYIANPYAGDPEAAQNGRQLFIAYNCYGCHGGHGGGGMGPSLRNHIWLFGDSPAQVYASIAQGRGDGMPAWGARIPQAQIWELVRYIKTLRTPDEPAPPPPPGP